jgi:hypothetical protein
MIALFVVANIIVAVIVFFVINDVFDMRGDSGSPGDSPNATFVCGGDINISNVTEARFCNVVTGTVTITPMIPAEQFVLEDYLQGLETIEGKTI